MRQLNTEIREGFRVNPNPFTLPYDSVSLDPKTKRALTICNLFVNHWLPIDDIAGLLEEDRRTVILSLIRGNVIQDRRHAQGGAPLGKERRIPKLH